LGNYDEQSDKFEDVYLDVLNYIESDFLDFFDISNKKAPLVVNNKRVDKANITYKLAIKSNSELSGTAIRTLNFVVNAYTLTEFSGIELDEPEFLEMLINDSISKQKAKLQHLNVIAHTLGDETTISSDYKEPTLYSEFLTNSLSILNNYAEHSKFDVTTFTNSNDSLLITYVTTPKCFSTYNFFFAFPSILVFLKKQEALNSLTSFLYKLGHITIILKNLASLLFNLSELHNTKMLLNRKSTYKKISSSFFSTKSSSLAEILELLKLSSQLKFVKNLNVNELSHIRKNAVYLSVLKNCINNSAEPDENVNAEVIDTFELLATFSQIQNSSSKIDLQISKLSLKHNKKKIVDSSLMSTDSTPYLSVLVDNQSIHDTSYDSTLTDTDSDNFYYDVISRIPSANQDLLQNLQTSEHSQEHDATDLKYPEQEDYSSNFNDLASLSVHSEFKFSN
jgi:hypothetical protein